MLALRSIRAILLSGSMLAIAAPAVAQTTAPAPDSATTPAPVAAPVDGKRVYTPADFARFAPKTAYDMLVQVPSFTIHLTDNSTRGLGQASENVLINGERIANKSGGAVDQLQRTSASNVDRIEIVDAATLGIAGLSGQVANIILKAAAKSSGAFEYQANARAHYTDPELFGGSISYSGKSGPIDYTLSAQNSYGRGGIGGPVTIYDPNHSLTETRTEIYHSRYEQANLQAKLGLDGPGSSVGNLTLGYTPYWNPQHTVDHRLLITGEERSRTNDVHLDGYYADINADYEFALGPGRLKMIGVRHWEHSPFVATQVLHFDTTGADDQGSRFSDDEHLGETVLRSEYHWKGGKNDWQLSFERAFNSLDQKGRLFKLDTDSGDYVEVPFPGGTGKVQEVRYESIATLSRPLSSNLDLQVAAGGEISDLDLVSDDEPARHFFRPKGSVTLGWRPAKDWDISLKLRRRVGQISFSDFLANVSLTQDRETANNPDLVPPQSWEAETEFNHDLGKWGKTSLNLHYYLVDDIVDFIPIGENEQGIGNLPRANRWGFESTSTFLLDPIGWTGAKVDVNFGAEWTSVKDPLTHQNRPISNVQDHWGSIQLRHDIPHTPFAWSAYVQHRHYTHSYYLTEIYRSLDVPWSVGIGLEDKDVFGMTVRLGLDDLVNGRHFVDRVVYGGYRDRTPVLFFEKHNQLVGPIFNLSVKGTF